MKLAIWAVLVVGVYFGYQFTIGNVFREYQSCHERAALELASLEVAETQKCVVAKLEYEKMNECVIELQRSSNLVSFLYQAAPAKKDIDADLDLHNENCPSNEIDPPEQSFYISAGASR